MGVQRPLTPRDDRLPRSDTYPCVMGGGLPRSSHAPRCGGAGLHQGPRTLTTRISAQGWPARMRDASMILGPYHPTPRGRR
jgi:hypothetical protein